MPVSHDDAEIAGERRIRGDEDVRVLDILGMADQPLVADVIEIVLDDPEGSSQQDLDTESGLLGAVPGEDVLLEVAPHGVLLVRAQAHDAVEHRRDRRHRRHRRSAGERGYRRLLVRLVD